MPLLVKMGFLLTGMIFWATEIKCEPGDLRLQPQTSASSLPVRRVDSETSSDGRLPVRLVRPPDSYNLQMGDMLRVKLLDEPDMDVQTRVGKDGTMNIPYIDSVSVTGKSIREAIQLIEQKLRKFYVAPIVTIEIAEFAKRQIVILGQVERPGMYEVPPLLDSIDLLEAIAMAGGATGKGDLGRVTVKRFQGGRETVLSINAKSIARNEKGKGFDVITGDTIIVQVSRREFSVLGQVRAPGMYELPPLQDYIEITEAIAMAGGASKQGIAGSGEPGLVTIKRIVDGKERTETYDVRALSRNNLSNRSKIYVMAGDAVNVQLYKSDFSVLGQVRAPGIYEIPTGQDKINLLEVIAMAGGATRLADLGSVSIRRKINEKEMVMTVDVKAMGRDEKIKPFDVIAGDRIVIGERFF